MLAEEKPTRGFDDIPEQFLLLVTCRDEKHQVELLQRFKGEGIQVKALISSDSATSLAVGLGPDSVTRLFGPWALQDQFRLGPSSADGRARG